MVHVVVDVVEDWHDEEDEVVEVIVGQLSRDQCEGDSGLKEECRNLVRCHCVLSAYTMGREPFSSWWRHSTNTV